MDYTEGMTSVEVRNDLLLWGVPRDQIRTALHGEGIRVLYNRLCEDIANAGSN